MSKPKTSPRITIRPTPSIEARLKRVEEASKRTTTSLILESIEVRLPVFERQLGIRKAKAA